MSFPAQPGTAEPEQDLATEEDVIKQPGIHQTKMMGQFEQSTQDSVHSAETNSFWVDTRKIPAIWDLFGSLGRN